MINEARMNEYLDDVDDWMLEHTVVGRGKPMNNTTTMAFPKGIAEKVLAVMQAVGSLETDKRNEKQDYPYISADKVLGRCRAAMVEAGLTLIPNVIDQQIECVQYKKYGKEAMLFQASLRFEMVLADKDGNIHHASWTGAGVDYASPDKAVYKAMTSGHKYFLMKIFNIAVGNEDGEHEPPQDARHGTGNNSTARVYGDGTRMNGSNNGKVFDAYVADMGKPPYDYEALRHWAMSNRDGVSP